MMNCHIYTQEERQFFKDFVVGHTHREIQAEFIKRFKWDISLSQVQGSIQRYKLNTGKTGRFEKGSIPWNKGKKGLDIGGKETRFKKGQTPINHRPVGSERITVDGYIEIKTAEPNVWEYKHRIVWEEHFGLIKKGEKIIFLDGDRLNIDINNLAKVSDRELLSLNRHNLISDNSDLTTTAINLVKLDIAIQDK